MCIICIDLDKGKLTPWEAARNRTEMLDSFDEEHLVVLENKINNALMEYLDSLTRNNNNDEEN